MEISFHLDNYPGTGTLLIAPNSSNATYRVRLEDHNKRRLFLNVNVTMLRGCGIEVRVFKSITHKSQLTYLF